MRLKEKFEIKKATAKDVEVLKSFWLSLAREMFEIEGYLAPSVKNSEVWVSFVLKSMMEGRAEVFIVQKGEEPVGFVYFTYLPVKDIKPL